MINNKSLSQTMNKFAKIIGNTNNGAFSKGDLVQIKKYDNSDDTYLIWKNGAGIWVKKELIEDVIQEEKVSPFKF